MKKTDCRLLLYKKEGHALKGRIAGRDGKERICARYPGNPVRLQKRRTSNMAGKIISGGYEI